MNRGAWPVTVHRITKSYTLLDPMDCSPPGSSVHGIFQAGVLEWGAVTFSQGELWGTGNSEARKTADLYKQEGGWK